MRGGGFASNDGSNLDCGCDCRSGERTLHGLLAGPLSERSDSPAILAPSRNPLSYGQLAGIIDENLREFRRAGIGAHERIALVLPGGPEMGVALLSTMIAGVAAPLNPSFSAEEFDFYLADLEAGAVLLQAGTDNPSRAVAGARGIPVIDLHPEPSHEAGSFRLDVPVVGPPRAGPLPGPDDPALLLHTSGTTSRPKLVPLTQSNLHFSALNIRMSLGLTAQDCCLNVMPLFHVHGLVAGLLASLAAGGSVVCTPGFLANEFFGWMRDFGPTWYTAVPTIHQSILAQADFTGVPLDHKLRFIRSCSASLSPSVMSDLERRFGVPVIEAYGMTEAAHQMSSNPLPPRVRKPGSVGLPSGIELAVLNESGTSPSTGESGEIVIRGQTVTSGYLSNPEANAAAFCRGWLRTGDIGYFDADGYLFLCGRSKEMINKAGEKISPREVEEVLLTHPAIAQAAAFGVKDERLGEEVAAAVVLKAGTTAGEVEIRSHVARKVAHFKVPRRVVFVDEIPKGSTGKLQRIGLAEKLGLTSCAQVQPGIGSAAGPGPRTSTEEQVLEMMQRSCGRGPIGFDDHFFEAGGDSIQAAAFLTEVKNRFAVDIPIGIFTINATVRDVSRIITGSAGRASSALLPIKKNGSRPPFFCVHPHDGRASLFYPLGECFDADQPFYAFQTPAGESLRPAAGGIERMAGEYVDALKSIRPEAPYLMGGYCFGALVALEMARILTQHGDKVEFLALIDSHAPGGPVPSSSSAIRGAFYRIVDRARRLGPFLGYMSYLPWGQRRQYLLGLLRAQVNEWRSIRVIDRSPCAGVYSLPGREDDEEWQFHPRPYAGSAVLFRPTREPLGFKKDPAMGWSRFITGGLKIESVKGYHRSLIFRPRHKLLADKLNRHLRGCQQA